jgi:hypothetical protein
MIEEGRAERESAVSNGMELAGVCVRLGSPLDQGERLEDELGSGVSLAVLL